ncbi:hypothetical protein TEA_013618 [Camellia sinensis var. sinensis]|uniref:Kinesin motor domain-containing protein n=1 Tax=Camellia sinensis var. sinensis TaxID=542762 RepID=A0A4V3WLH2_CAMSN|nr:hypothetical protein TEA_013618 [Camellia sinensis var. sinensis]
METVRLTFSSKAAYSASAESMQSTVGRVTRRGRAVMVDSKKFQDEKATHVPYRDSKLTRLLQSSLSGHGRVSLICTVTPASSNSEETHNTLKFAHRSKHVEIKASQNKIMDDKSLIKKYQKEISCLKQELQQLKRGMMENPYTMASNQEDLVNLKLQLEAGQVKLQSRLEEEEQAKAALMGRIQRLTKLILVSTKNTMPSNIPEKAGHIRRHSFGEDELAYLPDRKREYMIDDDAGSHVSEISADGRSDVANLDDLVKDYRRNRRRGMLGWFKLKKPENLVGLSPGSESGSSASGSPASRPKPSQNRVMFTDNKDVRRKSISRRGDEPSAVDSLPERTQAGDLFSATVGGRHLLPQYGGDVSYVWFSKHSYLITIPFGKSTRDLNEIEEAIPTASESYSSQTGTTIIDQMDLLREQVKMLAGEVALSTSSLKRLSEQAVSNPEDSQLQEQMQKLKDEIKEKKLQIRVLEHRMVGSVEMTQHASNSIEMSQALSKLTTQLNEKTFDLEIKTADNRILQEQLQLKVSENAEMQETILLLRQQLDSLLPEKTYGCLQHPADIGVTRHNTCAEDFLERRYGETCIDESTPTSVMSLNRIFSQEESKECNSDTTLHSQLLMQAAEIETLSQEKVKMTEEKDKLEIHCEKLTEEASYAKELAADAAVELRNLAEEVTKLTYQNAKLTADLAAAKEACCISNSFQRSASFDVKKNSGNDAQPDACSRKPDNVLVGELQHELNTRYQKETSLVTALSESDEIADELRKRLNEAKCREEDLENELANMWVLVAEMRKSGMNYEDISSQGDHVSNNLQTVVGNRFSSSNGVSKKPYEQDNKCGNMNEKSTFEELKANYHRERRRCKELESLVLRLKGDDISGLDITSLEELQNLHVEAITKICHAKVELILKLPRAGILTINSGHFNAHSLDFLTEFPKALSFLDQKTNVAVIVLSGNGDHFCSGIDLKALSSITFESSDHGRTAERVRREIKRFQEAVTAVERCRKPVITAVHGACIGGGVDIITACDIRCRKPVIASSIGCLCEPFNCRFEFLLACKGNLASTDLGFCCSSQHKSSLLYVQRDVSSVLDVLRLLAIALGLFQGLDDERGDGGDDGDFGLAVLDGELHGDSEAGSVIPRASSIGSNAFLYSEFRTITIHVSKRSVVLGYFVQPTTMEMNLLEAEIVQLTCSENGTK